MRVLGTWCICQLHFVLNNNSSSSGNNNNNDDDDGCNMPPTRDHSSPERSRDRRRSPEGRSHKRQRSYSPYSKSARAGQREDSHYDGDKHSRRRDARDNGDGRRARYRDDRDRGRERSRSRDEELPGPPPGPPPRGMDGGYGPPRSSGDGPGAGGSNNDIKPQKKPPAAPNMGLSGKLAAEANKLEGGIVLKYTVPPESADPDRRWRMYIFKNGELSGEPLPLHRSPFYMFGRDHKVADVRVDHPSCSKQHAVLQYRKVVATGPDGVDKQVVKPYIIDLGSVNGTTLNGERLEPSRYYELMEKDMVKFGLSTREYILLHDQSA